ncbi:hypothetical protein ACOMHN_035018 [Nucella lapillus]
MAKLVSGTSVTSSSSRLTSLHTEAQFMTADSLLQHEARRPRSGNGSTRNRWISTSSGRLLKSGPDIFFLNSLSNSALVQGGEGQIFQFRVEGVRSSSSGWRGGQIFLFRVEGGGQIFQFRVEGGQIFQFRVEGSDLPVQGGGGSDLPVQGGGGQTFQFRVEGVRPSSSGWRGSDLPVQGGGGSDLADSVQIVYFTATS